CICKPLAPSFSDMPDHSHSLHRLPVAGKGLGEQVCGNGGFLGFSRCAARFAWFYNSQSWEPGRCWS
ncbi:hypothetical protein AB9F45_39140, partial [Rhizobium leguminosarum]|uniref:hypothetical protein n=1 Tax=Rhizobium leguminosarum TaxID=384 RepID=UPI003F95CF07